MNYANKLKKSSERSATQVTEHLIMIDECLREISALDELYSEIVHSQNDSRTDVDLRKEEAKFAKERLLRTSIHIRNLVKEIKRSQTN